MSLPLFFFYFFFDNFLFFEDLFFFVLIIVFLLVVRIWLVIFFVLKFIIFLRFVEVVFRVLLFVVFFFDDNLLTLSLLSNLRLIYLYFCGLFILVHERLVLFVTLFFHLFYCFAFTVFVDWWRVGTCFVFRDLFRRLLFLILFWRVLGVFVILRCLHFCVRTFDFRLFLYFLRLAFSYYRIDSWDSCL